MPTVQFRPRPLAAALAVVALSVLGACATTSGPVGQTEEQALAMAQSLERRGDMNGALSEYVNVLSRYPKSAEAHYRVGAIHSALDRASTAQEAFQQALRLDPAHAGALEGMGLLLLEQGEQDAALARLHKAAAHDARRWKAFNGLGVASDLRGKYALAQAYFGHALRLQPNSPGLLNNMGYSQYLSQQYPAAASYFERVLAIEPGNQYAWSNLGLVHARQGDYPRAVRSLENVMDAASARYSVGYVCMLEGRLDQAENMFQASIDLSPSYNKRAQEALKRVKEERARGTASRTRSEP